MDEISQKIVDFYSTKKSVNKLPLQQVYDHITNLNNGLGDTISITNLPYAAYQEGKIIHVHSNSPYFKTLIDKNRYYELCNDGKTFTRAEILQGNYDCGNGHFFQRLERACGLKPSLLPSGYIIPPNINEIKFQNRIVLHLSVGAHAINQTHIHPRARQLYPEHKETLQRFINNNPYYKFVEIGTQFSGLEGVENNCGRLLSESIQTIYNADFFIGLHSGPMHVAAALGTKSIIIINFPSAKELYLPALKDLPIPDLDWLYPQNAHLHEDEDGELVRLFTYENLEKAIKGRIYPYWDNRYLELINETTD